MKLRAFPRSIYFFFLGIWTWTWAHNVLSCARSFWIWSPRCSQKLAWWMYAKHGGCEVTMQSLTIADSFSWHVFSIKLEWVYNIVLYYITYQTSFIVYVYHILYMYTCFIHVQNCRQRCFQIKHGSWWLRKVCFPQGQFTLEPLEMRLEIEGNCGYSAKRPI